LTRAQAERELRRLVDAVAADPVVEELSLEEAGRRHVDRLELLGRERSTLMDYRSTLRVHLVPFFGGVPITPAQIERYLTVKLRVGRAPKSIRTDLGLLYGVLGFAEKCGWVASNRASTSSSRARERAARITSSSGIPTLASRSTGPSCSSATRRAGIRDVRFHTFGTRMAAAGVPMRTRPEWMGHRDFLIARRQHGSSRT
jgi:hypothetical protein